MTGSNIFGHMDCSILLFIIVIILLFMDNNET